MTAGRPTKLTPELLEKCKQYIQGGYLVDELVPTIAGLCDFVGITRPTAYDWKNNDQEFSYIYELVMQRQEKMLLKGGLDGTFNAAITKMMSGKHGYSDKQETALTGADGGPIDVRDVTRTIIDPKH